IIGTLARPCDSLFHTVGSGTSNYRSRMMMATQDKPGSGCPFAGKTLEIHGNESRLDPAIRYDPFTFYRALREQKPVYYDAKMDVYLVTRYDDVMTVLRDPYTFSLEHGYQDR